MSGIATFLGVCLGAGLGAQMRYGLDLAYAKRPKSQQAFATLIANVTGSALIGVMIAVLNHLDLVAQPPWWSQMLTAGVAGGLTTFSTFTSQLIARAKTHPASAVGLACAHVIFGFAAALGAWWVTLKFLS